MRARASANAPWFRIKGHSSLQLVTLGRASASNARKSNGRMLRAKRARYHAIVARRVHLDLVHSTAADDQRIRPDNTEGMR